ncbi:MAG TPA: prolipoprotein diacylglyceryl transferase [Opitutaceae bacterium]|jgi:phosphatidylglycerol:prolipoprotein diacylglycerol transferase
MPLAFFVVKFNPYLGPHWGKIGIHYYGLAYMLGFLGAAGMLYYYAIKGRSRLPAVLVSDFMVSMALGVLVGGRVGYMLLYDFDVLIHQPLSLFSVWDGGMASHGGMLGVTLAIAWFARKHKLPFLPLGDLVVTVAPIGLFFGRLANFINGELWGKPTDVAWAMIYPDAPTVDGLMVPRHPSELYEAGLEGLFVFLYMQWRFWRSDTARQKPGQLCGEFFVVYAIVRVFCELYREPDAGKVLEILGHDVSRGTLYSIILFAIGLGLIVRANLRRAAER